jgi:predicted ester cyclase
MLLGAFPDLHMSTTHSISEGDLVAVFVTATGTHRGEFMGIPATGKAVSINMTDWMRVQNGKVTEHWGVMDMAGMMQQLGVGAP